jgi:hypothetical protein
MTSPPTSRPFHLLVFDDSKAQALDRAETLEGLLGRDAFIEVFWLRRDLLQSISNLGSHTEGEPWPIGLIDLQGSADDQARGEHLLATIAYHPALTDRVALVAFTRYGHPRRDAVLAANGARAVIHPDTVTRTPSAVSEALEMLAKGYRPPPLWRVGEPLGDDWKVLAVLATLFGELRQGGSDEERWRRAKEILLACRLSHEGYSNRAIQEQLGWDRKDLQRLEQQVVESDAADDPRIFPGGESVAHLGGVIDVVRPFVGESEAIWEITSRRDVFDGAGRLKRLIEICLNRDLRDDMAGRAWIPPDYVATLEAFLERYQDLRAGGPPHPSAAYMREMVSSAAHDVADATGIGRHEAEYRVIHAMLCLEDHQAEAARLRIEQAAGRPT